MPKIKKCRLRQLSFTFYALYAIMSRKNCFQRQFFPDKYVMDFFSRVKTLAKAKKITIESVVNTAGLTIDSYNSYKRLGNLPRADEAVKIAKTLETTVEFLVTGKKTLPDPDHSEFLVALQQLRDKIQEVEALTKKTP